MPALSRVKSDPPIGKTTFAFVLRNVSAKMFTECPLKRTSCTIEELFDDLDDGIIDKT